MKGGQQKSQATYNFQNRNGNPEQNARYDWKENLATPTDPANWTQPLRQEVQTYQSQTPDYSQVNPLPARILNAITSSEVRDASGTPFSRAEFSYDAGGNLTAQRQWDSTRGGYSNRLGAGNSVLTTHGYDGNGNRIWTVDALGKQTDFDYTDNYSDGFNRSSFAHLTKITTPPPQTGQLRQQTGYTYDYSTGLRVGTTDPNAQVTSYDYSDPLNRLKLVTRPDTGTTHFTYTDTTLTLLEETDLSAANDRLLKKWTRYNQSGKVKQTESSDPDPAGNAKVDTQYDFLGRVWVVTNPYRTTSDATLGWTRTRYDALSRVTQVRSFDGPVPADPNNPPAGTITTGADAPGTGIYQGTIRVYVRGLDNKLYETQSADGDTFSGWLPHGGPITSAPAAVEYQGRQYVFAQGNGSSTNRITTAGYSYDLAGNLVGNPNGTYRYDGENRLIEVQTPQGATVATYAYDANGKRIKSAVGGAETSYLYDSDGRLLVDYTGTTPAATKFYIYRNGKTAATYDPVAIRYNFWTGDHLDSVRVITDGGGAITARRDFLPFGEEIATGIGGRSGIVGYGAVEGTRHKFTSKERDTETGLDYFGARYYANALGRWTTPDVLLDFDSNTINPQKWNLYAYVLNRPLFYIDEDGLKEHPFIRLGRGSAIGSLVSVAVDRVVEMFPPSKRRGQAKHILGQAAMASGTGLAFRGLASTALGLGFEMPSAGTSTVLIVTGGLQIVAGGGLYYMGYKQSNEGKAEVKSFELLEQYSVQNLGGRVDRFGPETEKQIGSFFAGIRQEIQLAFAFPGSSPVAEALALHQARVSEAFARNLFKERQKKLKAGCQEDPSCAQHHGASSARTD